MKQKYAHLKGSLHGHVIKYHVNVNADINVNLLWLKQDDLMSSKLITTRTNTLEKRFICNKCVKTYVPFGRCDLIG